MTIQLDHLILAVNDLDASVAFYTDVLGLERDGDDGPFTVVRVTPDFVLLVAPWGTEGGEHLAFSMSAAEFDAAFQRIKDAGLAYGDDPHEPANMHDPGEETGAHGMGATLYVNDPSNHLIEIRHYD
jgi:catechol 2,3-dioxygenase-like lactoylglutathione lyase family enzyme